MEESKVINNENTYNTDISTSQSTINENTITNSTLNKDDLSEVTEDSSDEGVTSQTTIFEGSEIEQSTDGFTPILLILGDSTTTPTDDEEPVLLEEDDETIYDAVINSEYEDGVPTITLTSDEQSYSDANYVIAVTENSKNEPIDYDSINLSVSFTNNGNNWCSVEFKDPLNFTFTKQNLTLNSTNFPSNSNIIVPIITCQQNTESARNTTITFNIKNYAITHNIQMNVIQNGLTFIDGSPCVLELYNNTYNILNNSYYYIDSTSSYVFKNLNTSEHMLLFGLSKNNNINGNLTNTVEYYNTLFSTDDNNYNCSIIYNNGAKEGTAAVMLISKPEKNIDLNQTIVFKYNDIAFMKVKYMDNIKYKTSIYICALTNLQNYKTDNEYIIYLFKSDIGASATIKGSISASKIVQLHSDGNTDTIVACMRDYPGNYDKIESKKIGILNYVYDDGEVPDETFYQIKPIDAKLSAKKLGEKFNKVYIEDWTQLNVYDYNNLNYKYYTSKNENIYVYTIKDNKYVKIGEINFGNTNKDNYIGHYDYYYYSFQASTYNSYWFQAIHWYGDKNDTYYDSKTETETLNSEFKDKQFGSFDLYFVVMYNEDEYNGKKDIDIANKIIKSGKTYKKYQVPVGTYSFNMNNLIALTYYPKDVQIETIKTFSELYNDLKLSKSYYSDNFYDDYKSYNVINLNNVCNDINGNIINLNEVCKRLDSMRIYIFTKKDDNLVYIGVISNAHVISGLGNWNHYT